MRNLVLFTLCAVLALLASAPAFADMTKCECADGEIVWSPMEGDHACDFACDNHGGGGQAWESDDDDDDDDDVVVDERRRPHPARHAPRR